MRILIDLGRWHASVQEYLLGDELWMLAALYLVSAFRKDQVSCFLSFLSSLPVLLVLLWIVFFVCVSSLMVCSQTNPIPLMQAVAILERAQAVSTNYFQFRLLLIRLYSMLGAINSSHHMYWCSGDVKGLLRERLTLLVLTFVLLMHSSSH